MPKQSRLTRFYANYVIFDKFLPSDSLLNQESQLTLGDFIATWSKGNFYFGKLMRIIKQSIKGKCAHPQFIWKKSSNSAGETDFAMQILESSYSQSDPEYSVPEQITLTKQFKWVSSKDFVLKLDLQSREGKFIIEATCRKQLTEGMLNNLSKNISILFNENAHCNFLLLIYPHNIHYCI